VIAPINSRTRLADPAELAGPEERFLLRRLRRHFNPDSGGRDDFEGLAQLDWARLIRLAQAHHVMPLFCSAVLQDRSAGISDRVMQVVSARARGFAIAGTYQAGQLVQLLATLERNGIRAIPLKGPVLAVSGYGGLALRDSVDLDVLVSPQDAELTTKVLGDLGFGGWNVPAERLAAHLRTESENAFFCERTGIAVDLHWALSRPYFPLALDFSELWERRRSVRFGGNEVPALSREDALLHLCFHGAKHIWSALGLVCDVVAVVRAEPGIDWPRLMILAESTGTRCILLLALQLARDLMGARLPSDVCRQINAESILYSLGGRVKRQMIGGSFAGETVGGQIAAGMFCIRVRERIADRLRYCINAAMPNMRDWEGSRLPPWLGFVSVLSRPIRLLRKYSPLGSVQVAPTESLRRAA
jgi:hypothetical protein